MKSNIQVGDVVEWDMVTKVNQYTYKRIAEHGPGPFVVAGFESDGMVLLKGSPNPTNGVWPWRFKVNHFLTAVRKTKLSAEV